MKIIDIFTFNIEENNGIFLEYKLVKLGSTDFDVVKEICNIINNKYN